MRKINSLTKVLLKNLFNQKNDSNKKNKKGLVFLSIFFLIYFFGMFGFFSYNIIKELMVINQESLFLGLVFLSISMIIIFTTIFSFINVFYFSKDNEHILYLPLKPRDILISKFIILLIYQYIIEILFVFPALMVYGHLTGASLIYYIYSIIVLGALPVLPLTIVALIVMVIMCFSNLTKYKEKFQLFVGIFSIIFAIGIQIIVNLISNTGNEINMASLLTQQNSLINIISKYFITIGPSSNALIEYNSPSGLGELIILILITAVSLVAFVIIGERLYFKGLNANMENASKKKRKNTRRNILTINKRNIMRTYLEKEFKLLFRNPVFFMQCVLPSFLFPILFGVIFLLNNETMIEIKEWTNSINTQNSLVFFIILTIIQFINTMNYSSITAISREREGAAYNKTFPMPYYNQIKLKIMPGIILSFISIILCIVLIYKVIYLNILQIVLIIIVSLLLSILQNYVWIYVDLKKPKLNWDTEYAVAKQNFNMFYEMIVSFILMTIIALTGIKFAEVNYIYVTSGMVLVLVILLQIVDKYFRKNQNSLFDKIS